MREQENRCQAFGLLKQEFLALFEKMLYKKTSINNYRRKLNQLERYMISNNIVNYNSTVGQNFIVEYFSTHVLTKDSQRYIKTFIRRLDEYCIGKYRIQQKCNTPSLQKSHTDLMDLYLEECKKRGNTESTVTKKRAFLYEFFSHLEHLGCQHIEKAKVDIIGKACLLHKNKDGWAEIRMFLKYLSCVGLIDYDFSTIIPHFKRAYNIPNTYTEYEINRFESAIDITTKIGKRDYAMLLLATRIGMRSGDIADLTFSSLDFNSNTISIIQGKTNKPLVLPMIPVIKSALKDYITNGRPKSPYPYVFLRAIAPFEKITTSVIRYETTKYFKRACIDIANKKHGPHVFRFSLASSMINNKAPYEVVRKILGHTDPDAIKHYARVDLEKLREYSIDPPSPLGSFEEFLNGGWQL